MTGEREALIEVMARAMCANYWQNFMGMEDLTEGELWTIHGDEGSWLADATAALTAALSVRGTAPCPECQGEGFVWVDEATRLMGGCPGCTPPGEKFGSGSVDTGPLLVLASDALEAIAYVRRWYDEAIFPPTPDRPHTEVYDAEAAKVARLTCDNILREYTERSALRPHPEGENE